MARGSGLGMRAWLPFLVAAIAAIVSWIFPRTEHEPVPVAATSPPRRAIERTPELEAPAEPEGRVAPAASERAATSEREAPVGPSAEEATDHNEAQAWGRVELTVLGESSDDPVPGLFVDIEPVGALPTALAAEARGGEAPRLRRSASYETDRQGRLRVELRAGVAFAAEVRGIAIEEPLAELSFEPLAADEERKLVVRVAETRLPRFFVRVVAAENELPLPEASIVEIDAYGESLHLDSPLVEARWRDREPLARPGADGVAALPISPWAQKRFAALAPGRGPRVFALDHGADRAEHALQIPLARAASLAAQVVDRDGAPVVGARVRFQVGFTELQAHPDNGVFGTHAVEREAGAEGRCMLEGLTPGVAFRVALRAPEAADDGWQVLPTPLPPLAPGEARSATFVLRSPADVVGRAVDQHAVPAPGVELLLLRDERDTQGYLVQDPAWVAERRLETDGEGRFRLDGVPAGSWILAPRPRRDLNDRAPNGGVEDLIGLYAPLPTRFEITGDERTVQVTLALWRDLYVRGHVVPEEGPLSSEIVVHATLGEDLGVAVVRCEPGGSFVVGPLPDTEVELQAMDWQDGSQSPQVTANACAEGIELRLGAPGGTLSVRTVDATSGEGVVASLDALLVDENGTVLEHAGYMPNQPEFEWRGLTAGMWSVLALGPADLVGLTTGVEVQASGEPASIVLGLEPGGVLALTRAPDTHPGPVTVRVHGIPLVERELGAGGLLELRLPPTEVEILDHAPGAVVRPPRLVSVFAGERTELVLGTK